MDTLAHAKIDYFDNLKVQGYQYTTESLISKIALVQDGQASQSGEIPMHLLVEGEVRFIDLARHDIQTSHIAWKSSQHKLADWIAFAPKLVRDSMKQGCYELATQITETSQQLWKQ